ncbi:hypothetical protein AVEN_122954-1, partial [Araneus ventricosus]
DWKNSFNCVCVARKSPATYGFTVVQPDPSWPMRDVAERLSKSLASSNTFVCPLNGQLKAAFCDIYPYEVMPILTTDALWTVVNILGALNSLDKSQHRT